MKVMKRYISSRRAFLYSAALLTLSACGYRLVSHYAHGLLGESVYVSVHPNGKEPQNGVYLKEAIIDTVRERFSAIVTEKREDADSTIEVLRYHIGYSPLTYDKNGYVTRYRVDTTVTFRIETADGNYDKIVNVSEDVGIKAGSLTSSIARESAIRYSIRKAMDKLVAYVAQRGYLK